MGSPTLFLEALAHSSVSPKNVDRVGTATRESVDHVESAVESDRASDEATLHLSRNASELVDPAKILARFSSLHVIAGASGSRIRWYAATLVLSDPQSPCRQGGCACESREV